MIDVIAPLGLLLILAILGVIVWAARRQRQIRRGLLADYAETRALTYLAEDDGRVETAAQGFEGFARFRSASLGRVKPAPVVEGSRGHLRFFVFVQATRDSAGDARQWYVCLAEAPGPLCAALVKCESRSVARVTEVGGAGEVAFGENGDFAETYRVTATAAEAARQSLTPERRRALLALSRALAFPVDLQILGSRLAVYPAGRNRDLEDVHEVEALVDFACRLAKTLSGTDQVAS